MSQYRNRLKELAVKEAQEKEAVIEAEVQRRVAAAEARRKRKLAHGKNYVAKNREKVRAYNRKKQQEYRERDRQLLKAARLAKIKEAQQ